MTSKLVIRVVWRRLYWVSGIVILSAAAAACSHFRYPELPENLDGDAVIVMGYATSQVDSYDDGGTLYTGFRMEAINGGSVGEKPLKTYDFRRVKAGKVAVSGYCYLRVRGEIWNAPDDLKEPGSLEWVAKPNHVYTLFSYIDDYKNKCELSYFEKHISE